MTARGVRAIRFCKEASLYIDDAFERACCARPFADGEYQGEIEFRGLDPKGRAKFRRQMFADAAHMKKLEPVEWRATPGEMFRILRGELRWGREGLKKFEADPRIPAEFKGQLVGTKFPSAWIEAAVAMAKAPRYKIN